MGEVAEKRSTEKEGQGTDRHRKRRVFFGAPQKLPVKGIKRTSFQHSKEQTPIEIIPSWGLYETMEEPREKHENEQRKNSVCVEAAARAKGKGPDQATGLKTRNEVMLNHLHNE